MPNHILGVLVVSLLPGTTGVLMAFFPRVIPRTINSYWALLGMKSRLAEEDYEKLGVRVSGGLFVFFAIYVLFAQRSIPWK
jgi:threonine/homoserine/homoserine lactone efflux protein